MENPSHRSAWSGWLNGLLGVIIFSGSLPATRIAVLDFSPFFLTFARASIAGALALLLVALRRETRPDGRQMLSLAVVCAGVVVGFPLLTAMALQHVTSAHSMVFIGLLPLATALFGVLRGGERPRPAFWLFSVAGSLLVAGFALTGDVTVSLQGDLLMLAAVTLCGLGYAEGAALSRQLGGWQVIGWALILALPVMLAAAWLTQPVTFHAVAPAAWLSLGYVSLFSMLIGFVFWYKGSPPAASPRLVSFSFCSRFWASPWPQRCFMSMSPRRCWPSRLGLFSVWRDQKNSRADSRRLRIRMNHVYWS
ncbi:Permease of the drug/metabolite transporter (DMT) superfamily [Cronobacter dublinensis 1210]|uniref:Permease of the drug/metabolite transporter (DMT) superfamily n=1 Tax=Cronobacter dublinensis 1210 TaxID=1208656 RepID=A0ABP1WD10_9ENTR|nr:Permease of the drug/metabolite transporter (DMT) superfamily [Cronobacter dublinensis 1210]